MIQHYIRKVLKFWVLLSLNINWFLAWIYFILPIGGVDRMWSCINKLCNIFGSSWLHKLDSIWKRELYWWFKVSNYTFIQYQCGPFCGKWTEHLHVGHGLLDVHRVKPCLKSSTVAGLIFSEGGAKLNHFVVRIEIKPLC